MMSIDDATNFDPDSMTDADCAGWWSALVTVVAPFRSESEIESLLPGDFFQTALDKFRAELPDNVYRIMQKTLEWRKRQLQPKGAG